MYRVMPAVPINGSKLFVRRALWTLSSQEPKRHLNTTWSSHSVHETVFFAKSVGSWKQVLFYAQRVTAAKYYQIDKQRGFVRQGCVLSFPVKKQTAQ